MYVSGFVAHVTYYDLIFIVIEVANGATLAVWTFPRVLINEIYIKNVLLTFIVHNTIAMTALQNGWFF